MQSLPSKKAELWFNRWQHRSAIPSLPNICIFLFRVSAIHCFESVHHRTRRKRSVWRCEMELPATGRNCRSVDGGAAITGRHWATWHWVEVVVIPEDDLSRCWLVVSKVSSAPSCWIGFQAQTSSSNNSSWWPNVLLLSVYTRTKHGRNITHVNWTRCDCETLVQVLHCIVNTDWR